MITIFRSSLVAETSGLFAKIQIELKKLQNGDQMNLAGIEKDSAQYKEAQKNQRSYKTMTENFLKIKAEFDEIGSSLVDKQKMYIENAKKAGNQKTGVNKKSSGSSAVQ